MSSTHVTFCRICEASCGLLAEVEAGRVTALRPDPDHVVSRGFACVKGTSYDAIHHSPDRLARPQKKVGGRFVEIGWEQAIAEIGQKVRALHARHGRDSVGFYAGNPTPFSPLHLIFAKAFASGLGTRHVYTSASLDCNNKFVAAQAMFGSPMLQPIPDLDRLGGIVFIGANPIVSNMTFVNAPRIRERLAKVIERGGHVVHVNPRRTESAELLGEQVFIRPGTDVFFLLSFAHELLREGRVSARVERACTGLDALQSAVAAWPPERTEQVTRVPADRLRALVHRHREADGAAIYVSTGVNQGAHGSLCSWLAQAINVLAGHLDREGGMLVTPQMSRTAQLTYPSGRGIRPKRARIGGFETVFECEPVGIIPDEVSTPGPGQLRALFVSAGNLALTAPNSSRMREALGRLELLVCIDLFRNETGELADYVLPVTSFLERDDMPLGITGYQPVPYLQYVEAAVPPLGETRDEWWILTQLARACDAPLLGSRLVQAAANRAVGRPERASRRAMQFWARMGYRLMSAFYGRRLATLRRRPHGVLLAPPRAGRFLGRRVLTEDGRVRLAPERFLRALDELASRFDDERARSGELRLVSRRERTSHNSWMHNVPRFVRGARGTNRLHIHPEDAEARGLGEGDLCALRTRSGEIRVPVHLSEAMMRGSVSLPHGWGHAAASGLRVASRTSGRNYNELSRDGPDALEPLSGMAPLTGFAVECERVEANHESPGEATSSAEVD